MRVEYNLELNTEINVEDHKGVSVQLNLESAETHIAPGFQQTPGDVLGRSHPCGEGLAEQAAVLDQLSDRMSNLQQEVKHLGRNRVVGIDVFQCIAPILLHVKTFILDFPT